jgi:hypothetical protein
MVSHQHKCIFIHIPKTAGMSIENSFLKSLGLGLYRGECPPLLLTYNKNPNLGPLSLAHLYASEYLDYHYLTNEQFESYFKFSIVRNPYDRIVSIYKHFQFHRIMSFANFLRYEFPKLEKTKYYFIKPQYSYLFDAQNNSLVNYVGRFEDLPNIVNKIKPNLEHPITEIEDINSSLKSYNIYSRWNIRYAFKTLKEKPYLIPYVNLKNKTSYMFLDFFNAETLSFINDYYSRDFEFFEYKKIFAL